jgi:hypothetical protein
MKVTLTIEYDVELEPGETENQRQRMENVVRSEVESYAACIRQRATAEGLSVTIAQTS